MISNTKECCRFQAFSLLLLLWFLLLPTNTCSQRIDTTSKRNCFTSTLSIIEAQRYDPRPVYIVCPNTRIKVGTPTADFSDFIDGDWPLVALGPNVQIQCGIHPQEYGNSNCILDSSFLHVLTQPSFPQFNMQNIQTDNLRISGFTFTGDFKMQSRGNDNDDENDLSAVSVALQAPGNNMVIEHCVWSNVILADGIRVRAAKKASTTTTTTTRSSTDLTMEVFVRNSVFRNLAYFGDLVWTDRQRLHIEGTRFENITALSDVAVAEKAATAIRCDAVTSKAYCSIHNSCFQDVAVQGAMLQAYGNGANNVVLDFQNNYVDGLIAATEGDDAKGVCVTFVQGVEDGSNNIVAAAWREEEDPAMEYCVQLNTVPTCPVDMSTSSRQSIKSGTHSMYRRSAADTACHYLSVLAVLTIAVFAL